MYGECNNPECFISLPQLASHKHILFQIPFSFLLTLSCCSPVNVCLGPAGPFSLEVALVWFCGFSAGRCTPEEPWCFSGEPFSLHGALGLLGAWLQRFTLSSGSILESTV